MFGRCKVCIEREARIKDLHRQIDTLQRLVSPNTSASRIPLLQVEADAILSGQDELIEPTDTQRLEWENINREADRIFAGTYE